MILLAYVNQKLKLQHHSIFENIQILLQGISEENWETIICWELEANVDEDLEYNEHCNIPNYFRNYNNNKIRINAQLKVSLFDYSSLKPTLSPYNKKQHKITEKKKIV